MTKIELIETLENVPDDYRVVDSSLRILEDVFVEGPGYLVLSFKEPYITDEGDIPDSRFFSRHRLDVPGLSKDDIILNEVYV